MSLSFQESVATYIPLFSQESILFPGGIYFQTESYFSCCPPCDSIWWLSLELFPPAQELGCLQKSLLLTHPRMTCCLSLLLLQHNPGVPSNSSCPMMISEVSWKNYENTQSYKLQKESPGPLPNVDLLKIQTIRSEHAVGRWDFKTSRCWLKGKIQL